MSATAAGVASALAVLACAGPSGRALRRKTGAGGARTRGGTRTQAPGLEEVLVTVAAQLRAGRPPRDAWQSALGLRLADDVPDVATLVAACAADRSATGRTPHRRRGAAALERQRLTERAAAAVAAARTAHQLGAPLVGVLERVTESLAADAAERDDVEAALAGPRATARVLSCLPVLGLVLGTVLGADPVGVLLGGGLGTAAGVLGVLLLVVGRRWTAHLLGRAARAATASVPGRTGRRRRGTSRLGRAGA